MSSTLPSVGEPVMVSVVFSDGDPDNGGEVFEVEMLPHIRADDGHIAQVSYTPTTCGPHTLYAETFAKGQSHVQSVFVNVTCSAPADDSSNDSGGGGFGPALFFILAGGWVRRRRCR